MPRQQKATSIKWALIYPVVAISAISLVVSFMFSTWLDVSRQKEELVSKIETLAEIISFNASTSIIFDDPDTENRRLSSFKAAGFIDNIHIYKISDTDESKLVFFTSYNRSGIPPIPVKLADINKFQQPVFSKNYLELAQEIPFEGKVIGYTYVKANLQRMESDINNKFLINGIIGIGILTLAFFLALKIQQRITRPIERFLSTVQNITRSKDYSLRAAEINVEELDILVKAFNKMLDRVQQHITMQENAEREFRALNQKLEEKVSQRTLALKDSNQELLSTLEKMHQYQNHLVETEKMASLGQMVAGIAHEVNTPIGLGVTASTLMMDKLDDIQKAFEDKKLSARQLERFLNDGNENLGIIYRNLNRAAKLISSFKQVAVDQSNVDIRAFHIARLIDEVLLSLQPNLKNKEHVINVACSENLVIKSKPGPINQILINLIMNSLIHGFEGIDRGEIKLDVNIVGSQCVIHYSDNGVGVDEDIKNRIFDPFVTTKRGEGGSGLGMHLVYNLVTQGLGGSITIDSAPGQGVEFNVMFPVETCKESVDDLY